MILPFFKKLELLVMIIKEREIEDAIIVIQNVTNWLININQPLWKIEDITNEKLLCGLSEDNIIVGYINDEPATAMILQWVDKQFWPDIKENTSGFIHKLSVKRKFKGLHLGNQMIKYAEKKCTDKNINYLRLDCDGDRPKLCSFYEANGFNQIKKKKIGIYEVALYKKPLKNGNIT